MTDTGGVDRLVWVDLETFGLDPDTDPIIEVGFRITDLDLNTIDDFQTEVWDSPAYDRLFEKLPETESGRYVLEMHTRSELWLQAREYGLDPRETENNICDFLSGHGVENEPLCGSSVQFDRGMFLAQMPRVLQFFAYRNIDISSIKELCKRYNPDLFARLDEVTNPKKEHRVLADLGDTINEFRFYKQEFLVI